MSRAQQARAQRHILNKRARRLDHLERPVLRVIGDQVLTPAEVCGLLPHVKPKDVRRALLVLHDLGLLARITDSTSTLYCRVEEAH